MKPSPRLQRRLEAINIEENSVLFEIEGGIFIKVSENMLGILQLSIRRKQRTGKDQLLTSKDS